MKHIKTISTRDLKESMKKGEYAESYEESYGEYDENYGDGEYYEAEEGETASTGEEESEE